MFELFVGMWTKSTAFARDADGLGIHSTLNSDSESMTDPGH